MSFKLPSILITGCSSGIGLATAHHLKRHGWQVFPTARGLEDVQKLKSEGFPLAQHLDVNEDGSIERCLHEVCTHTGGRLDALFNNAGYAQAGLIEDITREQWQAQFNTNVFGVARLCAKVLPLMQAQGGGRLIQCSSVLGFMGMAYRGAYNASKYALEGLSDTLRIETAGQNIQVVLIEPGPIASNFRDNAFHQFQASVGKGDQANRDLYQHMADRFRTGDDGTNRFSLPPEAVARVVYRALTARYPSARYQVTASAKWLYHLKRWLPTWAFDKLLIQLARSEKKVS